MVRSSLVLFTALLFAACGGDSGTNPTEGGNNGGNNGGGTGSGRVVKPDPSFASDVQEVFDRVGCSASSCHGSVESAGLRLTSGNSHGELVNVQATSEPIVRVIPGNATGSYLMIKLEGRQTVGSQMPQGGAPLDTIDLYNIRNWINQGAKNN